MLVIKIIKHTLIGLSLVVFLAWQIVVTASMILLFAKTMGLEIGEVPSPDKWHI